MRTWTSRLVVLLAVGAASSALADRDDDGDDQLDWPMYNHDAQGSRHNARELLLNRHTVSRLHVKWSFPTAGVVNGTPVVRGDRVFAGDGTGAFYALDRHGRQQWKTQLAAPISASALVAHGTVVIGDIAGNLFGLDEHDGHVRWSFRPDANPLAAIFGSATSVGDDALIGLASNEELAAADPNFPCCSTRGSVVRFDVRTGEVKWQAFMVTDAEKAAGASGASVWSTPVVDVESNTVFTSTGNNFTEPSTLTSDAMVALDLRTGAFKWVNQRTPDDTWNIRFPPVVPHPDYDFGDSPQLYRLRTGQLVVGAGQKSGFFHVLDAKTGKTVNQQQLIPGGPFGGLFADSAFAGGVNFVNAIDWPAGPPSAPTSGALIALTGDASRELWRFTTPGSPNMSGVAVAGGVVYFQSNNAKQLFALDAETGAVLAQVPIGGSLSGPSIADGQVYVGLGDTLSTGFNAPGAIVALGL